MRTPVRLWRSGALWLLVFGCVAAANAQDFRGAIAGRISDAQGGRLPGATVTATNIATNAESTSTTDTIGDFTIPYLTSRHATG